MKGDMTKELKLSPGMPSGVQRKTALTMQE
jgi:hypothetical protein